MIINELTTEQINKKLQLQFQIEALKNKIEEVNTQAYNDKDLKNREIARKYEPEKDPKVKTKEEYDKIIQDQNKETKDELKKIEDNYLLQFEEIKNKIIELEQEYAKIQPTIE